MAGNAKVYGEPITRPSQPQQVKLEYVNSDRLDARIRKRLPIWVVNTATPPATLGLSFTDLNGNRRKAYQIPKSILPFCITNEVSHNMLRDGGTDLRNMLARGWVKLVTNKSARAYLATDKGRHEIDRLKRNKMMNSFTGENLKDYNLEPFMDKSLTELRDVASGKRDFSIKPEFVKNQIKDLVVRVEENTTSVRDAMSELEVMGTLGPDDLHYMMASSSGRLKQYATRKLEDAGLVNDDDDGVTTQAGGHALGVQERPVAANANTDTEDDDNYDMLADDGEENAEERTQRMRQQQRSADAREAAERDYQAQRGDMLGGVPDQE